jgi:hypothetical protein
MSRKKKIEPGDILRYRSRPRNKGEILCHNHVQHAPRMPHGTNGFRYFVCARGGGWQPCPCGWQPAMGWDGVHYAAPRHVRHWKAEIKKHGGLEAAQRHAIKQIEARLFAAFRPR